MTTLAPPATLELPPFELRGGARDLAYSKVTEALIEGPRGTGKTVAICWWIDHLLDKYPGAKALMLRKTLKSLTTAALQTFQEQTLTAYHPVRWYGGSSAEPASFKYANGSRLVVGGMDNSDKVLSTEYDLIYVNEATELTENEWMSLLPLLRHNVMPIQRLVGDCNPTHDKHWLLRRCYAGETAHFKSRHQDNPAYYDEDGRLTPEGEAYMLRLEGLKGSLRERWLYGKWTGVENAIYDNFDRFKHLGPVASGLIYAEGAIGVDYGDVHPHAVVVASRATTGRIVIRETWSGRSYDDLVSTVGRFRADYGVTRVRVDPMLKGWEKPENSPLRGRVNRADASPGSRKNRIELVYRLFGDNALTLDINGAGNAELADEIEMYHYVHRETETQDDLVVARINDDRVAALEYAIEELEGVNRQAIPTPARIVYPQQTVTEYRGLR